VCFLDLAVDKARLRYRSLLLTTNLKVALQVESAIEDKSTAWPVSCADGANDKWEMPNGKWKMKGNQQIAGA
jgi:hypothetical protein